MSNPTSQESDIEAEFTRLKEQVLPVVANCSTYRVQLERVCSDVEGLETLADSLDAMASRLLKGTYYKVEPCPEGPKYLMFTSIVSFRDTTEENMRQGDFIDAEANEINADKEKWEALESILKICESVVTKAIEDLERFEAQLIALYVRCIELMGQSELAIPDVTKRSLQILRYIKKDDEGNFMDSKRIIQVLKRLIDDYKEVFKEVVSKLHNAGLQS
jgi:hypothetical protein